jgi:hypothetical protein
MRIVKSARLQKPNNKRNTMKNNVIDIIQRFQTHHALQEEREIQNFQVSTKGVVPPANKSETSKNSIFETEEVRVSTVAVPGSTEWSPPHDGHDRLVVPLGGIGPPLPGDGDLAFPGRWTWVPANSDFKVPNEADQTRNLMVVEFNETNHQGTSQNRKEI